MLNVHTCMLSPLAPPIELSAKLMDALDELKVYYEKDARLLYQNLEE